MIHDGPPRLLVVSAHFPPDFVSGGTLVPDRQARGLAARGWDVAVYAGSVDPKRPPLVAWDDMVDGLPVRWIGIAPFTSWSDSHNFDNPEVVADLAAHLAQRPVDVVHAHSLQTLGGGVLGTARASGATTVVTMHDFWWSCARQFLVDRSWVPCSLVVDAGACACEVDRAWLDARNRWLRRELEHADVILAPSKIAAEVLAANGVPTDRLRVDENGLPDVAVTPPRRRSVQAPVRFRYAGGHNRMKGSAVLLDAATLLAERRPSGWRLLVHADASLLRNEWSGTPPAPVEVVPPFDPAQLDAVLADTDVLIVPSVMRESHSLLTREALLRGVPVISSDSLGPEDVVEPGRNGLVVPTGDARSLAAAIEVAAADPDQVQAWSAHAPAVAVRSATAQLDDLDALLRSVAPPGAAVDRPEGHPIRKVLFVVGIDGAPLRYRAHLPAEAMDLLGVHAEVRYYRDPDVPTLAAEADAVVVYRVPATRQVLDLLRRVQARRPAVPVVFDVDDLIFDPDLADEIPALRILPAEEAELWMQGVRRYRTTMEACDAFVGSTELLCNHARAVTGLPAHRFANGVGLLLARRCDLALRRPRADGPLRVGYLSGTTTHDRDWAQVEPAVLEVLDRHPDAELWLGGHLTPSPAVERLGPRLRRLPMVDWRALPEVLRDLDVNLAPLEPLGRFNEAKSAIKWLEAALCATPTIASPTQPFVECIDPGVNGFLADTPGEWAAALDGLLGDELLRARVGARARRDALLRWSPHRQGARYLEILRATRAAVAAGRPGRTSTFEPVVLDEPAVPSPLDPYQDAPAPALVPPPGPRLPRLRRVVGPLLTPWGRRLVRAMIDRRRTPHGPRRGPS
ncbi:MAG: glycosyltransferase [Acidimicrobiales bacterium]|nr:glycosyltransferase [Acidimicrobiales bacterium]